MTTNVLPASTACDLPLFGNGRGVGELIVEAAGAESWRVCDDRFPPGDGRFIALIDERDSCFDVLALADDLEQKTFVTMEKALLHLTQTCERARAHEQEM